MFSTRKFVGFAGGAVALSAAVAIAMSTQTGVASTQTLPAHARPVASEPAPVTLSAGCSAALQDLKTAFIADISEDRAEYGTAKLNGGQVTETDNDSAESANFMSLWSAVKSACAANAAATTNAPTSAHTFTPSAACTADLQALKAAWAQRPTTRAQWQQLQSLAQAARSACGWSSGWSTSWSFNR